MTDIDALQKAAREIRGDMSFLNASNNAETWLRHIKTSMDSTAKAIDVIAANQRELVLPRFPPTARRFGEARFPRSEPSTC